MSEDAAVTRAGGSWRQSHAGPQHSCYSADSRAVSIGSIGSPVLDAGGSLQQQQTEDGAGQYDRARSGGSPTLTRGPRQSAAEKDRAESSICTLPRALSGLPEHRKYTANAQDTLHCSPEASCSYAGRSGYAAEHTAMHRHTAPHIHRSSTAGMPSAIHSAAQLNAVAPHELCQVASRDLDTARSVIQRANSAGEEEVTQYVVAVSEGNKMQDCRITAGFPMLRDYLSRQPRSSTSCCSLSGQEEMLSALNSADLAYLVTRQSMQQFTMLAAVQPVECAIKSMAASCGCDTCATDSDSFHRPDRRWTLPRDTSNNISRSTWQDEQLTGTDDLVLHGSNSEAALTELELEDKVLRAVFKQNDVAHTQHLLEHDGMLSAVTLQAVSPHVEAAIQQDLATAASVRRNESLHSEITEQQDDSLSAQISCDSLYDDNDWEIQG